MLTDGTGAAFSSFSAAVDGKDIFSQSSSASLFLSSEDDFLRSDRCLGSTSALVSLDAVDCSGDDRCCSVLLSLLCFVLAVDDPSLSAGRTRMEFLSVAGSG